MDIKPIRTEADYDEALTQISGLLDAPEGSLDADRLEVLSTLVESYEERRHPIDPPDPVEAIKFRMEHMGLTRKDLEPLIGGRGRVSEVLNRKRRLSLSMIRNLHAGLGIPAEILIGEPDRTDREVPQSQRRTDAL